MRLLGSGDSIKQRFSPATPTSEVGGSEEGGEDIVKVPVSGNLHGKEVSVLPFNPQKYEREEIWLTIFQVHEVTSPLRAVSQQHDDELVESLQYKKYQYGVGFMSVANPVSGSRSRRYG